MRTVIVGAGVAGVSAAGALRAAGRQGEIVLIGDEPELPYRRPPVSKEIVRGEKTTDEIRIKKAEWFADQQITLRTGTTVTSIGDGAVHLGGEELAYDQLLLATGGRARNPWDAMGIRTLRSVADVPRLQPEMAAGKHLIVVGAGLIGSEIAASARGLGCEVTLLETADVPLPRLLPPELAQMYVDLHKSEGADLHTNVTVESITTASDEGEGKTVVRAGDGRSWSGPVVVVAVGMEPNVALAEQAGLAIAPPEDGGGILVDEFGHTSAPGIFAAGDVANQPNLVLGGRHRVEHWQGAQNHGTAVGKVMAGGDVAFSEVPWCWSDQYGHTLQVVGWPLATHELVVRGSLTEHDFTAYLLEDGIVRGAVAMARPGEIRTARKWIADGVRLEDVLS